MRRWLQRLRGAIGTALTWAVGWCAAGLITGTTGLLGQLSLSGYLVFGFAFATLGFASGAAFSIVLSLTEGRRRFDQMSLPRFGLWGALGGGVIGFGQFLPLSEGGNVGIVTTVAFFMLLGASSSAGSLLLARWAERDELLESAKEIDEVGLNPREARDLLGQGRASLPPLTSTQEARNTPKP